MDAGRFLAIAGGVITGVLFILGIVGFVTAEELGGFALIIAGAAWLVLGAPLLLAALIGRVADEYHEGRRRPGAD
jgi:hypothetical protein